MFMIHLCVQICTPDFAPMKETIPLSSLEKIVNNALVIKLSAKVAGAKDGSFYGFVKQISFTLQQSYNLMHLCLY